MYAGAAATTRSLRQTRRRGRGGGGASGSSRIARSCAGVLMVSVRPEAMRRGALEGGERGTVADQRLDAARLGTHQRHLRVGQLDDVSDPGLVAALGQREVLPSLLQPLVRHTDALGLLAQVEQRLPHLEAHVVAGGVLGRPQVLEVGLRLPHLRPGEPAVEDGEADQAAEVPALLERIVRAVPRDVAFESKLGKVVILDWLYSLDFRALMPRSSSQPLAWC